MFNKHPKGLIAASFANLGERFGFYTMMAILVLFLQAKFGLDGKEAGLIYSTFYFSIYILALIGGIIADRTRNYKGTIFTGIVLMAVGYLMLAIPSPTPVANKTLFLVITCAALFVIAFGNGLFKGNLQALVGQMYDNPQYSSMRDSGFSLFYMFINVGAIFAPFAAVGVRNWWLSTFGYNYDADLPALCHGHLAGTLTPEAVDTYSALATKATISGTPVTDMTVFANEYLNVFTTGFLIMAIGSYVSNLPMHKDIIALGTSPVKVTPLLLMVTYLILTVAELYISPLGISFVSKVAPPKYQGIMQGGWLGATAIGNQLLVIGAILYESIPIWMTWTVFVVACCISMFTMLFMLKWLEKVAK